MKLRVVIDVEKGIILLQNRLGMEVKLLPLIIVNMLQLIIEYKFSHNVQWIAEGMQGFSLVEQPQLET